MNENVRVPIKTKNKFVCVTVDNLNQLDCTKTGVPETWIERD